MSTETSPETPGKTARQVLDKALIVLEIIVGYMTFSFTGAVGIWLVFKQFVPLGRLLSTMQEIDGAAVLLASLIKMVLFIAVIYSLQRLRQQTMSDLGLQSWSIGWTRLLLVSVGLPILGQGLLIAAGRLIGGNVETNMSAFDLSTPVSIFGWIGVGWIHGGFLEELLYRGFLFARFEALFGRRSLSTLLAVLLLVVFFGLGHAYQGVMGIILTANSSLVFWGAYFLSKRNLWTSMIAHGCWDTIGWLLTIAGV